MLNISEKDKAFLLKNINNAEDLLSKGELQGLLEQLSLYLNYVGFDENWEFTDEGRTVQAIYDRIYFNN